MPQVQSQLNALRRKAAYRAAKHAASAAAAAPGVECEGPQPGAHSAPQPSAARQHSSSPAAAAASDPEPPPQSAAAAVHRNGSSAGVGAGEHGGLRRKHAGPVHAPQPPPAEVVQAPAAGHTAAAGGQRFGHQWPVHGKSEAALAYNGAAENSTDAEWNRLSRLQHPTSNGSAGNGSASASSETCPAAAAQHMAEPQNAPQPGGKQQPSGAPDEWRRELLNTDAAAGNAMREQQDWRAWGDDDSDWWDAEEELAAEEHLELLASLMGNDGGGTRRDGESSRDVGMGPASGGADSGAGGGTEEAAAAAGELRYAGTSERLRAQLAGLRRKRSLI